MVDHSGNFDPNTSPIQWELLEWDGNRLPPLDLRQAENSFYAQRNIGLTYTEDESVTVERGPNLALGKTANQSSTTHNGEASRAVDGNTNGNWQQGSITHTAAGVGQSWEVDLCGYYPIGDIVIYNRTNCCSFRLDDITVSVEDLSGNVVWSENVISSSATSLTVNAGNAKGRVIRITQNQNEPLSLAEVEVYEGVDNTVFPDCLLYTSPSPRDA